MSFILRLVFHFFAGQAKLRAVLEIQRRSLAVYLRFLQGSRRLLAVMLVMFGVLQLMMLSLVGAIVTGFLLWDYDFAAKLEILFWSFTAMFSVPALILAIALSDYVWFRVSGARKMVEDFKRAA